jgi:hypothetical protein
MPLTKSGMEVLKNMSKQYGEKKGKSVFYASVNAKKPGSEKWEGNPSIESPAGEHVAAIHTHMEHIGNAMSRIADHVNILKKIRAKQKAPKVDLTPDEQIKI